MSLAVPLRKEEDFERVIGVIKKFDFARAYLQEESLSARAIASAASNFFRCDV
jgi:hypothetical protein